MVVRASAGVASVPPVQHQKGSYRLFKTIAAKRVYHPSEGSFKPVCV